MPKDRKPTGSILSGTWRDPYSRIVYHRPSTLDCDHVVPLPNAWISGARRWTLALRARYANDPVVLLMTSAHLNRRLATAGVEAAAPRLLGHVRGAVDPDQD